MSNGVSDNINVQATSKSPTKSVSSKVNDLKYINKNKRLNNIVRISFPNFPTIMSTELTIWITMLHTQAKLAVYYQYT